MRDVKYMICSKSQNIFDQKLRKFARFLHIQKNIVKITKKYDPLKTCTMEEMKISRFTDNTEINYKKTCTIFKDCEFHINTFMFR